MALTSVYQVVAKRADYTRTPCGWRGEFRGPFTIQVEANDLESCRYALFEAAEVRVAQWLTGEWREPARSDTATPTAE